MKKNLKKFKKLPFLFSIILLVASSSAFMFVWKAIHWNVADSASMELEWQNEEKRRDEMQKMDKTLMELESERMQIDLHFIKSSDVVPVLNLIESLGPKVGAVTEVTLVDIPKDGSSLVVGIKSSGTFESLYKFLQLLENSPYELEILNLDIQSQGGPTLDGKYSNTWLGNYRVKLLSFFP